MIALLGNRADCVRELLLVRPEFCMDRTPQGLLPLTYAIKTQDPKMIQAFVQAGIVILLYLLFINIYGFFLHNLIAYFQGVPQLFLGKLTFNVLYSNFTKK